MYVIVLGLYSTINTEAKSLNEILRKLTRWFVDNPNDIGQRYIYIALLSNSPTPSGECLHSFVLQFSRVQLPAFKFLFTHYNFHFMSGCLYLLLPSIFQENHTLYGWSDVIYWYTIDLFQLIDWPTNNYIRSSVLSQMYLYIDIVFGNITNSISVEPSHIPNGCLHFRCYTCTFLIHAL